MCSPGCSPPKASSPISPRLLARPGRGAQEGGQVLLLLDQIAVALGEVVQQRCQVPRRALDAVGEVGCAAQVLAQRVELGIQLAQVVLDQLQVVAQLGAATAQRGGRRSSSRPAGCHASAQGARSGHSRMGLPLTGS
jgi:hypothetical protein